MEKKKASKQERKYIREKLKRDRIGKQFDEIADLLSVDSQMDRTKMLQLVLSEIEEKVQ